MTTRQRQLFEILAGPVRATIGAESLPIPTAWVAITGAPGSGKSTVCAELEKAGYPIIPEASRAAINEAAQQGFSVEEIFAEPKLLSEAILIRKLAVARSLAPSTSWIWDTGLVDALVFCDLAQADVSQFRSALLAFRFRKIVLLEPLNDASIAMDPVRPQSGRMRERLHESLIAHYESHGYPLARIRSGEVPIRVHEVREASLASSGS